MTIIRWFLGSAIGRTGILILAVLAGLFFKSKIDQRKGVLRERARQEAKDRHHANTIRDRVDRALTERVRASDIQFRD